MGREQNINLAEHVRTVRSLNIVLFWRFQMNGICRCAPNYAGTDCSRLMKTAPNIEMLVDGQRSSGDSRFPAARAGHTLLACGHLKLYVFGGFSLEHGLLGDLWSYDQLNGEWERLEPRIFFPAAR